MTTEELNTIVQAVVEKINEQVVDFDVVSSTPENTDLLSAVRPKGDGTYQGVTLKWDDVANAVTREAKGYRDEAASAKTNVENMKASVDQTVSDFNTLAEQKKAEVQGVYQTDLNELKGDIVDLSDSESSVETLDIATSFLDEYISASGTTGGSGTYVHTDKITVKTGDIFFVKHNNDTNNHTMRFVTAYKNGAIDSSKGSNIGVSTYTVPDGVDEIVISFSIAIGGNFYVKKTTTITTITPKGVKNLDTRITKVENSIESIQSPKLSVESVGDIQANNYLLLRGKDGEGVWLDLKKNCSYEFYGEFSSFGSLMILHGNSDNHDSGYVLITSTNIEIHYINGITHTDQLKKSFEHGLTLSNFISVCATVNEKSWITVRITTTSGTYKTTTVGWTGCNAYISANSNFDIQNAKLSYTPTDLKKDVMLFGDSYTSIGEQRYPYYLIFEDNITGFSVCGFAGAKSTDEIKSFRNMLKLKKPKIVVWAMGMNDHDSEDGVNADWKACVDEVIASCDDNEIELVLATIPNVPSINHTFKNDYVRNSGKRYVDFAKVVGAESQGSSWYSGMLSTDNVHPTELGARALASRFLVDVPEVIN